MWVSECIRVYHSVYIGKDIFGKILVLELSRSFDASIYAGSAVGGSAKGRVRQLNSVNKGHFAYFLSCLLAPGKPAAAVHVNSIPASGNFKDLPFPFSSFGLHSPVKRLLNVSFRETL